MVGFELLALPQRDNTPETSAKDCVPYLIHR
jgi:hypothetical protein